jgi:hypothetical protein
MDASNVIAVLSVVANLVLALIVYSFKATIRVAILEAVAVITKEYATKAELEAAEERLKEQISLRNEIRAIPARLHIAARTHEGPTV